MAPFKSSLSRSASKLLGAHRDRDTSLRGFTQQFRSPQPFSASGGDQNGITPGNGYKYHTYTTTGPATFTVASGFSEVEVLIVGGGAKSGPNQYHPGGGGAGGLVHGTATLIAGTYDVVVGEGGSGPDGTPVAGGDSSFSTAVATGGGRAMHYGSNGSAYAPSGDGTEINPYGAGGSGGGGGAGGGGGPHQYYQGPGTQAPQPLQGSTLTGYGNPGGLGTQTPNNYGGGGGGAGEAGYSGSHPTKPARGGDGRQYPQFTGPLIGVPGLAPHNGYYAGGGGGGTHPGGSSTGGLGGGGNGSGSDGSPGVDNTGGGAGGSERDGSSAPGVTGGSGIVIVRYQV